MNSTAFSETAPPHRRTWLQFSVARLLGVVLVSGVLLGNLLHFWRESRLQRVAVEMYNSGLMGIVESEASFG